MGREEKKQGIQHHDVLDADFMDYVGYEHGKYKSMMHGNKQLVLKNDAMDDVYTHYVSVYEFIYDAQNDDANEQCFGYLEPFELCLIVNDHDERIVWIENEEMDDEHNNEYSFNFEDDHDWDEINEVIMNNDDDHVLSIEKCVRLFAIKMCVHSGHHYDFKAVVYKA